MNIDYATIACVVVPFVLFFVLMIWPDKREQIDISQIEPLYTKSFHAPGMGIIELTMSESKWLKFGEIAKSRGISRDRLIVQAYAGGMFDDLFNS